MANLYELVGIYEEFSRVYNQAETEEEMLEAEALLLESESNLVEKIENISRLVKNFEAERDSFKREANRLNSKARSSDNKVKNLKRYLEDSLNYAGVERVKGDIFTVSLQNNPLSLSVSDLSDIPEEFIRTPEPTVKKRELLNYIKSTGEVFEGVKLEQKKSLRIR